MDKIAINGNEITMNGKHGQIIWDEPAEEKRDPWLPEKSKTYWYKTSEGEINWDVFEGDAVDLNRYHFDNMFPSQEACEASIAEDMARAKIKAYRRINNMPEPTEAEWKDTNFSKHQIVWNAEKRCLESEVRTHCKHEGLAFAFRGHAEEIIEKFPNELKIILGVKG